MNTKILDNENVSQPYIQFAITVVLGLAVAMIYNLADIFFIGRTGNTALLAGVSLCTPVYTTLMAFGNLYGQGGSSLIRKFSHKKDKAGTCRVSSFCFYAAMLTSFVLSSFMLLYKSEILILIGTRPDTIEFADQYLTIMAVGVPVIMLTIVNSNFVCCEGMMLHSVLGIASGAVVNIILNPFLIKYHHMGAKGAGLATITGYMISNLYFVILIKRKSKYLSLEVSDYLITMNELSEILRVSFTVMLTNFLQSMCIILINQFLVPYGNEKVAAMGIVCKLNMIFQLILIGFGFGCFKKYRFRLLSALSIVFTMMIYIFAPYWMRFFVNHEGIIRDGTTMLRWQVSGTLFLAVVFLVNVYLHTIGKILTSFFLSMTHHGIIIVILIFSIYFHDYQGLLMSQVISDFISAIIAIVIYLNINRKKHPPKTFLTIKKRAVKKLD